MSGRDALRQKQKGEGTRAPTCSKCGGISVLDPCRTCATPSQLAAYPPVPIVELDCGHIADARERFRTGNEKWCSTCMQWRPLAQVVS